MQINISLIFQFIKEKIINMRLGLYVGSFNPVHNGHLKVINYLLDHDLVDKVFVLATPNYWNKQDLACVDDRVAMLKFFENKNIIIDTIHNNYPYTSQVLIGSVIIFRKTCAILPKATCCFIGIPYRYADNHSGSGTSE